MKLERTIQLLGYFGSARMCARLVETASAFTASLAISRHGEVGNAKSLLRLMLLDAQPLEAEVPARAIAVTAVGPDAAEALQAILDLFPKDGGPETCVVSGCGLPACLLGRFGSTIQYRCADYDRHHEWCIEV